MRILYLLVAVLATLSFAKAQNLLNVAYKKPASANFTCGLPPEEFYNIIDSYTTPPNRVVKVCNASDPKNAHPPSNLVDGSMESFWQSTAWKAAATEKAYLQIDLEQVFYATKIKITFGLQRRPGAIKIMKSTDYGSSFSPYHYLVKHPETVECPGIFGVTHYSKGVEIDRVDRVLCQHYDSYTAQNFNETIEVDLTRRSRGVQDGSFTSEVLAWLKITNLRFEFLNMYLRFDRLSYKFNHYTVREIEFFARCNCNGHGDGNICPQDEITKRRSCSCKGNTCGENCQTCCPLYNQKPWSAGAGAPWSNDNSISCEPCNCFNHSEVCVFNQTVNDLKMSLDIHGNRSGGGVCQNCKNNTHGINCEKCDVFHFRPKGRDHGREDACLECQCDVRGTTNVSSLAFLDCVSDEDQLSKHPGKQPGDCYCKKNVMGSKCNKCKPEYYNLTSGHPEGCRDCKCHLAGTVDASNICNTGSSGQCPCKANVELRDCSQCKYGYYNLTNSSDTGCQTCNCDEGGTYPQNKCDKISGQCQCRPNVIGKKCVGVAKGYYFPDLHFISACRSPYKNATNHLSVKMFIPKNSTYQLQIKTTSLVFDPVPSSEITSMKSTTNEETNLLRKCLNSNSCHLPQGTYSINITAKNGKELDCITFIPMEFIEAAILGAERRAAFQFQCGVEANEMKNSQLCYDGVFSLSTAFNNGSLPCQCSNIGAFNHTTCQEYAGQCSCKPGVEGRDCSRCKPGFYNLTENGCQPCACKGPYSVCHPETGWCECPANTVGRTCEPCQCNNNTDRCLRNGVCLNCQHNTTGLNCENCVNETYGNALKQQCRACECNSTGSLGSFCDIKTGQCVCKSKISGRACDRCQNNTYGYSSSGCTDCRCNAFGSASLQCDENGHCPCKEGTNGTKCSMCTSGYYGLGLKPCQTCNCNATGTVPGTICTNDAIGQCKCKPGVTGRACDRCDKYYRNFTNQGCTTCPDCVIKLTKSIESTVSQLNSTKDRARHLENLASLHSPLEDIETMEQRTLVKSNEFTSRLNSAKNVHDDIYHHQLPQVNTSYYDVQEKNDLFNTTAPNVANNMASQLLRIQNLHSKTSNAETQIKDLDTLIREMVTTFSSNVHYSTQALQATNESVTRHMPRNFTEHHSLVERNTKDADNLTAFVASVARKLLNQTSYANELNAQVEHSRLNLTQLLIEWNTTHVQFLSLLNNIRGQFLSINNVIRETQIILSIESDRLNKTKHIRDDSNTILNKTKIYLQSALTSYELYKAMVTEVTGELQVSMLKYVDEGNWFVMKILGGRNLSARDMPGGKADPYVNISLVPGNFEVQKSTVKKDTLNPTWEEFEQIFRFNIAPAQLRRSKLKLQVFDDDSEDQDDFMGEVVIDLSVVGGETITNWYQLKSEDVSNLESGDFRSTSGLVDASNLLKAQKDKVTDILATLEVRLALAHQRAQLLRSQAEAVEQEFSSVESHGLTAVQAIQRYIEIERLVNNSMETLSHAQSFIMNITFQLNQVSASALINMSNQELNQSSSLYSETMRRNLSDNGVAHVEHLLTQLNNSLRDIVPQWHQAYSYYPALIDAASRLKNAAIDAPSTYQAITHAQKQSDAHEQTVANAVQKINEIERQVNSLLDKMSFIKSAGQRDSRLIQEAFDYVNNASSKMNSSESSLQKTKEHEQVLKEQSENVTTCLNNVERKLNELKKKMSQVDLGLKVKGGFAAYPLLNSTSSTPTYDAIAMTFRTNSSQGGLLSMKGNKDNSQETGIKMFVKDGKVVVDYNTGNGDVRLTSPNYVNTYQWTDALFTRQGATAALTVESSSQSFTVQHNAGYDYTAPINFPADTSVHLGQYEDSPTHIRASSVDVSSLVVNEYEYNLPSYTRTSSNNVTVQLSLPENPNKYLMNDGQAATFSGKNSFIRQKADSINFEDFGMELSFRTFESNGVLLSLYSGVTTNLLVYLDEGRLYVEIRNASSSHTVSEFRSTRVDYNQGNWVHFSFQYNNGLGVLNVTHNETVDSNTNKTVLISIPESDYIVYGNIPQNKRVRRSTSKENFRVKAAFIGDIKNPKIRTKGSNALQSVSLKESVNSVGVYTEDVIAGKVETGAARFYGFTEDTNLCSYVAMNNGYSTATSLAFTFKTSRKTGLLLYSEAKVGSETVFFYMALWHGNLQILTHNSSRNDNLARPYVTSGITFSDNMWRRIYMNSTDAGYSLYVNGSHVHTGWFGTSNENPLKLSNPLYVGGVLAGHTIPLKAASTTCFEGGMKHFQINDNTIDLFDQNSVNVIKGGVVPAKVPPPPTPIPPTCAAAAGPITVSTNPKEIGFSSGLASNPFLQTYIQPSTEEVGFGSTFMLEIQLKPLSANGLILYRTDNVTNPQQFVSLELIDGRIKYQVYLNPGHLKMESKVDYANREKAEFIKVNLLYIIDFAAFLVPQTKEYHNDKIRTEYRHLNLTGPMFVGSVPSHVVVHPLVTQRNGFSGCISKLETSKGSAMYSFDLSKPVTKNQVKGCISNAVSGFGLNGSSWIKFDNVSVNTNNLDLQLEFRTWSRRGVILHLMNNKSNPGGDSFLKLEQADGQLLLVYKNPSNTVRQATWTAPSSHLLCNMTWHNVRITGSTSSLFLVVDKQPAVSLAIAKETTLEGQLFIGGTPTASSSTRGFSGCIKNVRVEKKVLDYGRAADAKETTNGCADKAHESQSSNVLAR